MKDTMAIIADRWMMTSRQLVNWGSYDGFHEFLPSTDDGLPVTLLAGASESGKSTLVDAQISLLYPTGTPYNKASNTGRSERNDYTYLRGMLGIGNDGTGDVPIYLRGRDGEGTPQPVWGAIVDTYENRTGGETLSCAKFLYLAPGDGRGDVRRQYVVWDRKIDPRPMDAFRDAPFTPTALKATYEGCLQFSNAEAFHAHIWHILGLSEAACRLLYKIQSADAPSRLDDIFKQGVLGVPEALELARNTVDDYDRYDENFRSMEEKAKRIARLREVRQAYDSYVKALRDVRALEPVDPETDDGRRALHAWTSRRMTKEVLSRLPDEERKAGSRQEEVRDLQRRTNDLRKRLAEADTRLRGLDDGDRARLESEREQAGRALAEARELRNRMEPRFHDLDESFPVSADAWQHRQEQSAAFEQTYARTLAECERKRAELIGERAGVAQTLRQSQRDLQRQHTHDTRITQSMDDARALIAHATGLDVSELPYVAELMDVKEDCEQWRTAMNVVYAPLAQTILIDRRHERGFAEKVSTIDPSRMMRRTWRFIDTNRIYDAEGTDGWISGKLRYREDSPFVDWLKNQTCSERFDARCVDSIDDMDNERQVQVDGQLKSANRGYHGTKGLHPIIGFTNAAYLDQLRGTVDDIQGELRQKDEDLDSAKRRIDRLREEHDLAMLLSYTSWESIDTDGLERRIDTLTKQLDEHDTDPQFTDLAETKAALEAELDQSNQRLYQAKTQYDGQRRFIDAARQWLDGRSGHGAAQSGSDADPDEGLAHSVSAMLDSAYESNFAGIVNHDDRSRIIVGVGADALAGETFEQRVQEKMRESVSRTVSSLTEVMSSRKADTETRMSAYLDLYAHDDDALAARVEDYRYYRDELSDLERLTASAATGEEYANSLDKLLMDFTQINRAIDTDANDIGDQLDRINAMLDGQKFGPRLGSLSIGADVRRPERSFTARLKRVIGLLDEWKERSQTSQVDSAAYASAARKTFSSCSGMITMLRHELDLVHDANGIRDYGARNLDPRCRSSFYATVHHAEGPDERITSTGGKSGGALQELTSFVYGAALIYLLGGDVTGRPTYTTLFLDEALIKADGRYTQRALSVLPRLGFQVIVSAPESKTAEILEIASKAYVAFKNPADSKSYLQEASLDQSAPGNESDATS
ncbi:hypothetical protein KIH77_05375 [Bifidobacterium sp. 82T24]|uniref:ATP-binding protein n=1 Tax=Bifidobacterium pluvialisilvae TaxID=2834436 RepID=UPI001C568F1F|nr:ATP-binding protein [Bifidobacterium pluvialisilvae]MBW3088160.1 hypothetical protein [Bifidobacterium pluvialisilvae]